MVHFPSKPGAHPFTAPKRFEADVFDCEVEGEVPETMRGTFYRACTDRRYPPRFADDAVFNEDGAIDMFRFCDGHVDFRTRFVRTPRFLAERKAGRALFGYYRNKFTSEPEAQPLSMNTANTNIIFHGGKLLALKESDPPVEVDPHTLETLGNWDFGGRLSSLTFTAHPKIDPLTGEMICYGYEAKGDTTDDVVFYWVNREGEITRELWFKSPVVCMMHDIAVTGRHIILPTTSYLTSMERLRSGQQHWAWERGVTTYVAVIPRNGTAGDIRWFESADAGMMVHTINAVSEGDRIVLDAPINDANPFPWVPNADGSPFDPQGAVSTIRRWTFDLGSNSQTWREEVLFPGHPSPSGLSRMDDRYISRPFRYSYMGYHDPSRPFDREKVRPGRLPERITNCYGVFDHVERTVRSFYVGPTQSLQEVCFVPRHAEAPEGDGWLIGVASDYAEVRSELVIVDALEPERGTVARVKLPFRLHSQVHGNWVPDTDVPVNADFDEAYWGELIHPFFG